MIETKKNTLAQTFQASTWTKQSWKLLSMPLLLFLAIPILALFIRSSPAELLENLKERLSTPGDAGD